MTANKKITTALVSIVALLMWVLSTSMNAYTGWTMGGVIGYWGGVFGLSFMIITEFMVPASIATKSITGKTHVIGTVGAVMAVTISIFAFWNGTALSLNTHLATLQKSDLTIKSSSHNLAANRIKSEKYTITPEQSVKPLLERASRLLDPPAKNLAGHKVFKDGKVQSIRQATNNCSSGIYFTDERLYKNTCHTVTELFKQVRKIRKDNKTRSNNSEKSIAIEESSADLYKELAEMQYKKTTTLPFIDILLRQLDNGKVCEVTDESCKRENERVVKNVSSSVALWVAVFAEIAKVALLGWAISLLIPNSKLIKTNVFVEWFRRKEKMKVLAEVKKAKAHGEKLAELEHSLSTEPDIDDIHGFMRNAIYPDLKPFINVTRMIQGTKNINVEDLLTFTVLVCNQYSENTQIPIHSTVNYLRKSATTDTKYVRRITKAHRLRTIILPELETAGIVKCMTVKGKYTYFWESEDKIKQIINKHLDNKTVTTNNKPIEN